MDVMLEGAAILGRSRTAMALQRLIDLVSLEDLRGMEPRQILQLAGGISGGAGLVDAVEANVLSGLIQDPSWAGYANLWLSLSSTTPVDAGTSFTEPSGGAYARVSTAAADWSAASGTTPVIKQSGVAKSFPAASADWASAASLTYFGLHDASTAGNLVCFGLLTTAKPVLNGDTASFAINSLTLQLGDPGDAY